MDENFEIIRFDTSINRFLSEIIDYDIEMNTVIHKL